MNTNIENEAVEPDANEITTEVETTVDAPEVSEIETSVTAAPNKRKRVTIIAAIAAFAVGVAVAAPLTFNAISHSAAVASYDAAMKNMTAAQTELTAALKDVTDAQSDAATQYTASMALLNVTKGTPAYFDPQNTIADLEKDINTLSKKADVVIGADGNIAIAIVAAPPVSTDGHGLKDSASTEQLDKATRLIDSSTEAIRKDIATLTAKKVSIEAALKAIDKSELAVMSAGVTSGTAFARPEKASDESWNAYTAALEAIKVENLTAKSDRAALAKAYVDARNGVQASHDAAVAAEQAAANAAAQRNSYSGGGSSNGGNSSGGSISGGRIDIGGGGGCPATMICYG